MAYHHGNLRDTLIYTGDLELQERGPESLSLREIAKRAGVSHNAPYRHFESKSALIDQIIQKTLTDLSEQMLTAPLLYPASVLLQVQYVGRLWCRLALQSPKKAHLIFSGQSRNDLNQNKKYHEHQILLQNLITLLSDRRGNDLKVNTPCDSLSLTLIACIQGLTIMQTSDTFGFRFEDEEFLELSDRSVENILLSHLT